MFSRPVSSVEARAQLSKAESLPDTRTEPDVRPVDAAMTFSAVDFPEPLCPMIPNI